MPSSLLRFLAALLPGAVALAAAAAAERGPVPRPSAPLEDPAVARVIVKYREGGALLPSAREAARAAARPQRAALLSQRFGLALADGRAIGSRMQAVHGRGLSSSELAARLAADPDIEYAVPSLRRQAQATVPNDPYYGPGQTTITPAVGQWYLRAPDATAVSAINAVGAWERATGAGVVVAVLDTGVRFDHPDLAGKLHPGYDFVSRTTASNDSDGRDADAGDPGDWSAAGECGQTATSSSWHGTQVSGLIGAATDNGIGMASVGRDAMVLPVRVLGKCGGYDDDILAAMLWAAGLSSNPVANPHPARVLNLSLGSRSSCSAAYRDVLAQLAAAGVTVVAAAGNDVGLSVESPANCSGVVAVGGVRHVGTKVGYSNVGPEVAISAPAGNCVNTSGACLYPLLTTTNAGATTPGVNTYSSSGDASVGTSFSAPLVAGTAALMLSMNPSLTPTQLRAALQASARAFPTSGAAATVAACRAPTSTAQDECYCTTTTCGAGMLDASAAVAAVAAANLPVASIAAPPAGVTAGASVTLDGSASRAAAGATIAAWQWTIAANTAGADFTSATNAPTATLLVRSAGTLTISLTVTDSLGRQTSTATTINVAAATSGGSTTNPPTGGTDGGSGGGGALGAGALGGLALAVLALQAAARRREER